MDEQRSEVVARLRAAGCVYAEDEAALLVERAAAEPDPAMALAELVAARVAGHPLETLLGWVAFAGRRLQVGPGVFVPRRRTELLARLSVAAAGPDSTVVELCCGVAPVAATVLAAVAPRRMLAGDLDPVACAYASRNVGAERTYCGDLFDGLPHDWRGAVDVLAANAPYVPSDQIDFMPLEARAYEPHATLDGGGDGVDVHRRIAAGAPEWLSPGGVLLIETGREQSAITARVLEQAGFTTRRHTDDDLDATVVEARRRPTGWPDLPGLRT